MARPATGAVRFEGGRWKARITVDGEEYLVDIEPPLTDPRDREKAKAEALELSKLARKIVKLDDELAEDWFERWCANKRDKGQGAEDAESHLENHILPVIGKLRMVAIDRRDLERIVQQLDELVAAGELKWKSAINIWGTVTKAFDDAHRGKVLELRVRRDNPARDVRGPDRGIETEKVHLYPDEFLKLVSCAEIPLLRRRGYAIAIYCYLRPGELEALRWEDINLARETIQVRRAISSKTDLAGSPKAGRARATFDLEPELVPLLRAMHAESGGVGTVVGRVGEERAAELIRRDLLLAGVARLELHHCSDDPPRLWMTMHDCRTTGITWMAVEGVRPPFEIMARAGHRTLEQTQGYIDTASLIRRNYGKPFPPLPPELLAREPEFAIADGDGFPEEFPERSSNSSEIVAEAHGNRTHRPPREGRAHPF